jgi:hypothetical protein
MKFMLSYRKKQYSNQILASAWSGQTSRICFAASWIQLKQSLLLTSPLHCARPWTLSCPLPYVTVAKPVKAVLKTNTGNNLSIFANIWLLPLISLSALQNSPARSALQVHSNNRRRRMDNKFMVYSQFA